MRCLYPLQDSVVKRNNYLQRRAHTLLVSDFEMDLNQSIVPEYMLNLQANPTGPLVIAATSNATENGYIEYPVAFKVVQACFLASFMLVGIIGNICVCVFIIRAPELRTKSNTFYICLSIANIGVATNCIPFTLSSIYMGRWTLGANLCYLNGIANPFWITATCYSVTASTVHKFISVTRPMKHLITHRIVTLMVVAIWTGSTSVSIWPMLKRNQIVYKPVAGHCGYNLSERREEVQYLIFLACAVLICPTAINVYCYVRMFRVLNIHRHRMRRSSIIDEAGVHAHKRNVITLYVVFVVFFITWLPFNIYSVFFIINNEDAIPDWLLAVGYIFAYSTCAQVPVIIICRSAKLKSEFKSLLRTIFACFVCCRKGVGRRFLNKDSDQVETEVEKRISVWIVSTEAEANAKTFTNTFAYENRTFYESQL